MLLILVDVILCAATERKICLVDDDVNGSTDDGVDKMRNTSSLRLVMNICIIYLICDSNDSFCKEDRYLCIS